MIGWQPRNYHLHMRRQYYLLLPKIFSETCRTFFNMKKIDVSKHASLTSRELYNTRRSNFSVYTVVKQSTNNSLCWLNYSHYITQGFYVIVQCHWPMSLSNVIVQCHCSVSLSTPMRILYTDETFLPDFLKKLCL